MWFEWDAAKAATNELKHGVPFEEAATCFLDPQQDHSEAEDREILIGHSNRGRLLVVVSTLRGEAIRPISARRATRQEAKDYARGI